MFVSSVLKRSTLGSDFCISYSATLFVLDFLSTVLLCTESLSISFFGLTPTTHRNSRNLPLQPMLATLMTSFCHLHIRKSSGYGIYGRIRGATQPTFLLTRTAIPPSCTRYVLHKVRHAQGTLCTRYVMHKVRSYFSIFKLKGSSNSYLFPNILPTLMTHWFISLSGTKVCKERKCGFVFSVMLESPHSSVFKL